MGEIGPRHRLGSQSAPRFGSAGPSRWHPIPAILPLLLLSSTSLPHPHPTASFRCYSLPLRVAGVCAFLTFRGIPRLAFCIKLLPPPLLSIHYRHPHGWASLTVLAGASFSIHYSVPDACLLPCGPRRVLRSTSPVVANCKPLSQLCPEQSRDSYPSDIINYFNPSP
ncbi:hypothetical protein BU16DRAFT_61005 [Lophium mytilinum]|uniref:Uncharacterized protein n=1 Tax=Lophium mytilinum TaxID=390894 RepID=A0A6A6QPC6_9PEZI|nr:hypothetical protein BU16DRAFT_61005 [Lophium mytilinum]